MKVCFTRASMLLAAMLLLAAPAMAQYMVKGSVKDALGEPLIGVSILVKGTTTGTVTDFDGNYELNVPDGEQVAIFSYTGFKTQELTVSPSTSQLDIVLEEDIARLDEVRISLDAAMNATGDAPPVERTRVQFTFLGPAAPQLALLERLQRDPETGAMVVGDVLMKSTSQQVDEARLELSLLVARLHERSEDDEG